MEPTLQIAKNIMVYVYQNPITLENIESIGVVTKVLRKEDWTDVDGNPIYRCNVRFSGSRNVYERDVSVIHS